MRSADGRRHGGGKWKLGWGNGDTEASGQQSNSFLSVPLGPGTSWAVLCSWAPSWAPSSGSYRVNEWMLGRREPVALCVSLG